MPPTEPWSLPTPFDGAEWIESEPLVTREAALAYGRHRLLTLFRGRAGPGYNLGFRYNSSLSRVAALRCGFFRIIGAVLGAPRSR